MQMKQSQRPQLCDLPGGTHGYCCTSGYSHTVNKIKRHNSSARSATDINGNQKYLRAVIDEAKSEFNADINKEKRLKQSIGSSQPTFFHNLVFR